MRLLVALVAGALLAAPALASEPATSDPEPITIGEAYAMETHDAARQINVVLPRGYEKDEGTYPIIVMLDGGRSQDFFLALGIEQWNQLWGRSQPAIFVGVETVDRQRELLPPTETAEEAERYPTAGEADAFRSWLLDEVLPMIRARYRDNGRAILVGESAAGHFVAETWVKHPASFDGYAALSPSLQWNNQSLSRELGKFDRPARPPLFISLADEGGATEEGALRFVAQAKGQMCFADRRSSHVHHANSLHQLLPQALQFLLPTEADWLEEYGLTVDCNKD
ncbi:alpha/beta hydrolase [Pontixanthobacter aquaemixtae]|uniref:Alpha/beta hydrolase n=1 Tax=Pontixanthobacter aquaemixtae TaxID=1958940 RepID=A0A844ZSR4_9SPHN|nr:alpha/beta hydrolase-fold protein [Pontixanthobacter aquaemixtae]MXO90046.1 alpha/beta hydrolase [Pontixanthobacter aquaemixtae]